MLVNYLATSNREFPPKFLTFTFRPDIKTVIPELIQLHQIRIRRFHAFNVFLSDCFHNLSSPFQFSNRLNGFLRDSIRYVRKTKLPRSGTLPPIEVEIFLRGGINHKKAATHHISLPQTSQPSVLFLANSSIHDDSIPISSLILSLMTSGFCECFLSGSKTS